MVMLVITLSPHINFLTLVLLNLDMHCLGKECRSRSVTYLDLCWLSFSMWICINNLDQAVWLADRSGHSFLTFVLLSPDIPCLYKQCRSRAVGWSNLIGWQLKVCSLLNYIPDIRSMWGYIVFAFLFVRSFVRSFVCLSVTGSSFCVKVYKASYFEDPLMDFVHIWHGGRYRSKVFISTIPTPWVTLRSRSRT